MKLRLNSDDATRNKLLYVKCIKSTFNIGLKEGKELIDELCDIYRLTGRSGTLDVVEFFHRNGLCLNINGDDCRKIFIAQGLDIEVISEYSHQDRQEKIEDILTVLTIKSIKDKSEDIKLTYISLKNIDLTSGSAHIVGLDIWNNSIEIYFSLNNYTIIC